MISILSVGEVNRYLGELLQLDGVLQDLWVRGEISSLTRSQAGHMYYTLKDGGAQLRCVTFRNQVPYLSYLPAQGLAVVAHGRVGLYEAGGQIQLYVDLLQPEGVGELYLRFEQLRSRLEREGLFDPSRKRALPAFPRRIALVTSPAGAAMHDVLRVLSRRFPGVEVLLAPSLVQGEEAAASLVAALNLVNRAPDIDVAIVARGGGSLEDLWAFNEEPVARAIFASRVPVVCGIGHETDVTIADMVADLRAPTPSVAAELVVPDRRDCATRVDDLSARATYVVDASLRARRQGLGATFGTVTRSLLPRQIRQWRIGTDDLLARAQASVAHALAIHRERLRSRVLVGNALDPAAVLGRGYSVCWHLSAGQSIKSVRQVGPRDRVEIQVADGFFTAAVEREG